MFWCVSLCDPKSLVIRCWPVVAQDLYLGPYICTFVILPESPVPFLVISVSSTVPRLTAHSSKAINPQFRCSLKGEADG